MSNAANFSLLTLILFTPLVGVVVLMFVDRKNTNTIRWVANISAGVGFLVSLPLWFWYDTENPGWQFVERHEWIPSIGADYFLGVDGFSSLLILLTTLLGLLAILSSWTAITERVKEYYVFLLTLLIISFSDMHKFLGLISTKTGLKLFWITEFISDTHVRVGNIISPLPYIIFNTFIVRKFAEDPELTNTLYLTPSHFDHSFSNLITNFDCVNTVFLSLNSFVAAFMSLLVKLLCIKE